MAEYVFRVTAERAVEVRKEFDSLDDALNWSRADNNANLLEEANKVDGSYRLEYATINSDTLNDVFGVML